MVEDCVVWAEMVRAQFLAAHEVKVVPSLAEARDAIEAGTFDAFLVDYDLPDGKGSDFVTGLRERGGTPKIIAISAHDTGNRLLIQAGASRACPKNRMDWIEQVLAETCGS